MTPSILAFGLLIFFGAVIPARAAESAAQTQENAASVLTVCLDENVPPFSSRKDGHGAGFDVALSAELVRALGRRIAIRWFESQIEVDKSPALEANALLSDGLCDLVGNYPATEDSLEAPRLAAARLPGFEGAKPADRRRRVTLGKLIPSAPVRHAALGVVAGPAAQAKTIRSLSDLAGLRIGAESGTFADIVLMRFGSGSLINTITHVAPGHGALLNVAEAGNFDAILVDTGRFDAYRLAHPDTKLKLSSFVYRIGFNMGYVALSANPELIRQVDDAIEKLRTSGKIDAIARAEGVTYLAPREPAISPPIRFTDLQD